MKRELKEFLLKYRDADPAGLSLSLAGKPLPFPLREAVMQLECRQRSRGKLPYFLSCGEFRFPDALSAEQATDERVARYHASLTGGGKRVVDVTAGLGIDAMSMARAGCRVTAVELDPARAGALRENAQTLGIDMEVRQGDGVEYVRSLTEEADLIFIDPARRDSHGRRTYGFADCTPDLTAIKSLLLSRCSRLMVKASPLLDITQILRELPESRCLRVVACAGECKEILIELTGDAGSGGRPGVMEAVEISREGEARVFSVPAGEGASARLLEGELRAGMYMYEPSAAVMKLAPWGELCRRFGGVGKLDVSTHLFAGRELHEDFPGRVMRISAIPSRREMKGLRGERLNVATRNHPMTPAQISARYGLLPSPTGTRFLYGARVKGKPVLLLGEKLSG